jgi:hypothetical protein
MVWYGSSHSVLKASIRSAPNVCLFRLSAICYLLSANFNLAHGSCRVDTWVFISRRVGSGSRETCLVGWSMTYRGRLMLKNNLCETLTINHQRGKARQGKARQGRAECNRAQQNRTEQTARSRGMRLLQKAQRARHKTIKQKVRRASMGWCGAVFCEQEKTRWNGSQLGLLASSLLPNSLR